MRRRKRQLLSEIINKNLRKCSFINSNLHTEIKVNCQVLEQIPFEHLSSLNAQYSLQQQLEVLDRQQTGS